MIQETTLLLIEDNPGDARLFQELLRDLEESYQVVWCTTLAEAGKKIESTRFHLILCDLGLPDSQGSDTVIEVVGMAMDIPIIILTGQDDDRIAVQAIQAGVQDYLVKHTVTPELLSRAIRYAVERKRNEMAIRKRESQLAILSQAVEQSPVSVMITDTQGNIEYVNSKFVRITGYLPEEVKGKTPRVLKSGQTSETEYKQLWETIKAGDSWQGEFHNRKKDGSLFWERAFLSPVRDRFGNITHFLAIKEDITAEKNLEKQLIQAQKLESVGRLAGGVAHDFNNMLNVILGYTDIASNQLPESHPVRTCLEEVKSAASRSAELTRQLLGFARKQTVLPVVLNLNQCISNMLNMLHRLIGEGIELIWKPGLNLWSVRIDPSQIDQLLANLMVNARDAVSGTGVVTIQTENMVFDPVWCENNPGIVPGEYVNLSVSDNGCGMDEATIALIFEPFFTTKQPGVGAGLGLSTVYGIVKQNHGFIQVFSKPGAGSTFHIYFPRELSSEGKNLSEAPVAAVSGNETILLVEDEESILKLYTHILGNCGYHVLSAKLPMEAIAMAASFDGRIDLVVTDVVMPGMNGRQLADTLKASRPDIRILYISGYTADVIAQQGVLEKNVHFLQKPFSVGALAKKVREVLDHFLGIKDLGR